MPRDLADVLHYFLPELDDANPDRPSRVRGTAHLAGPEKEATPPPHTPAELQPSLVLPLIGVPIGDRDLVRAALTWNLAIEMARLGGRAVVVAPASSTQTPLWPEAGVGPLGCELIRTPADNLLELQDAALRIAAERTADAPRGGSVFVRVPPQWIAPNAGQEQGGRPADLIRWWLLMTSSHQRHLDSALEIANQIQRIAPAAEVGATIHGVSSIAEARRAYGHLARRCTDDLGVELKSYGLLVDDLDVYRAIASQRPIGLAHPQAPATRALTDVASLLYDDARSRTLG